MKKIKVLICMLVAICTIVALSVSVFAAASGSMSISTTATDIRVGDTFTETINYAVEGTSTFNGGQFVLDYDKTKVELTKAEKGASLADFAGGSINLKTGAIGVSATAQEQWITKTSNGTYATLEFKALAAGELKIGCKGGNIYFADSAAPTVAPVKYVPKTSVTPLNITIADNTPVVNDHTVTFDIDGATSTAKVADKAAATKPADPTKDGYTFKHWSLVKDGADAYDFTTPVTGDITLYAVFEKNPPKAVDVATGTRGYVADFEENGVTYKNLWVGEYTLTPDGKAFKITGLTISGNKNGAAAPDKNIPSGIDTTFEGKAEFTFKVALTGVDDPGSMAVTFDTAYVD